MSALISLQALAAVAAPCSPLAEGSASMAVSMEDSPHHAHHGAAEASEAEDDSVSDCCDSAYCSQGGCLSIPAAATDPISTAVELAQAPALAVPVSTPLYTPNRLYRPPSA